MPSDVRANGALDLTVAWSFQRMTLAALPARRKFPMNRPRESGRGQDVSRGWNASLSRLATWYSKWLPEKAGNLGKPNDAARLKSHRT